MAGRVAGLLVSVLSATLLAGGSSAAWRGDYARIAR
jgi:hypothetical protein